MPVTPMSSLTCPAIADNQSPVPFQLYAGHILTFFISLLFTCCLGIFFRYYSAISRNFFSWLKNYPRFLRNQKSRTSNKCKIRKIKSGIFSRFRFVCDLTTRPVLRACEFYVIPFLFVFLWNLPFVRDVHEIVVHTLENYYREEISSSYNTIT